MVFKRTAYGLPIAGFVLAERESRDLHARAFDMTYASSWYDAVRAVVNGEADLNRLFVYYSWNSAPDKMFSFVRRNDRDKVFAMINFSDEPHTVSFSGSLHTGRYREYFSALATELDASAEIELGATGFSCNSP